MSCGETQMFGSTPLVNPSSIAPRIHLLNESIDLKGFSASFLMLQTTISCVCDVSKVSP